MAIAGTFSLVYLFFFVAAATPGRNETKSPKFIFSTVQFRNDPCNAGQENEAGLCMSSDDCQNNEGTVLGNCASGKTLNFAKTILILVQNVSLLMFRFRRMLPVHRDPVRRQCEAELHDRPDAGLPERLQDVRHVHAHNRQGGRLAGDMLRPPGLHRPQGFARGGRRNPRGRRGRLQSRRRLIHVIFCPKEQR